jgi:sigma-B regulation protein RsbU (phosphoserine phosphatase)
MPEKRVILAVDDTPENLDVVKGILSPEWVVKAAINGPMALKIAEKQPPDLILLDVMMPEMDGYEVCRRLKSNPLTRDIPVIFLTAMDKTADEASGFELGAADYITKPINPPILEARVRTHLALKQSMDDLNKAYSIIKKQKDRMEEELNIGRNIQMSMVPLQFPAFPERDDFDLYAFMKPAREVGGDFYDFFLINEDELCMVIGDVSGKGVPAALFMAVTRTMTKTRASDDNCPATIITHVNQALTEENPECMFVTLFLCICDLRTGELTYTNAGHNPPYIKRADGHVDCIRQLHGPIAGALGGISYTQDKLKLHKDDLLLLFTDGVSEAMDMDSSLYGEEAIVDCLSGMERNGVRLAVDSLTEAVVKFAGEAPQSDDITLLAFRYDKEPGSDGISRFSMSAGNSLPEIGKVIEAFDAFSDQSGVPTSVTMKFNVVLDDLLTNIISYAFPDGGEHEILIHGENSTDRLRLVIEDDGQPFDPFALPEVDTSQTLEERQVGGLGIHLVKNVMDEASYLRNGNKNLVTLTMNLQD